MFRLRRPSESWPSSSTRARSATSASRRSLPRNCGEHTASTRSALSSPSGVCGHATSKTRLCPRAPSSAWGFVPYSPLGRGFLTGTLAKEQVADDFRGGTSGVGEAWDANHVGCQPEDHPDRRLHRAAQMGVSAVPIPGSRKPERGLENFEALYLSLDATDMGKFDTIRSLVRAPAISSTIRAGSTPGESELCSIVSRTRPITFGAGGLFTDRSPAWKVIGDSTAGKLYCRKTANNGRGDGSTASHLPLSSAGCVQSPEGLIASRSFLARSEPYSR